MEAKTQRHTKYIKLLLYVLIIVLVNVAGLTLFFRVDLTQNKVYSLSPVSQNVVATLSEPLTIKVFFTKDLPAPHNNTELYLRDLLDEYALNNRKHFKVHFYNVSPETEGISDETQTNRQMARDYGINPVQIQLVEKDEIKFKQAYMGLVLIHGDIVEKIPTITSTDGLEYKLTTAIQKLNHKVSALLGLDEEVKVTLVLSSSMFKVGPYMGLKELEQYPEQLKEVVAQINAKSYGKLAFSHIDPSANPAAAEELKKMDLMHLNWPDIADANVKAGEGLIGMVLQHKDQSRVIPLLNVVRLPIFGTQYQLAETNQVEELINVNLERLININEDIGYVADFGTPSTSGLGPMAPPNQSSLSQFGRLINKTYALKMLSLKEKPVPEGLKSLIIVRPTEEFSDHTLYQIDQALMRGTNLAIFLDAFKEIQPPQGQPFMANQGPMFVPFDSGLKKLLSHYGIRVRKSIVLDENSYRQRLPQQQGGGERAIYFVPIIKNENINAELDYMRNIKQMITVKISPLELDSQRISDQNITAHRLFSSSKRSWEMRDRINLNPMLMQPPASGKEMDSMPLAYMLEGSFTSYFKGKPMPEKPAEEKPAGEETDTEVKEEKAPAVSEADLANITEEGAFREQSPPAKILVVASSEMLSDNLLDNEGMTTNAMFVLNVIDALNGREAIAAMRSKEQRSNPLEDSSPEAKTLVKAFNMAGLPILVVLFGLLIWWRRHAWKKRIQMTFQA